MQCFARHFGKVQQKNIYYRSSNNYNKEEFENVLKHRLVSSSIVEELFVQSHRPSLLKNLRPAAILFLQEKLELTNTTKKFSAPLMGISQILPKA